MLSAIDYCHKVCCFFTSAVSLAYKYAGRCLAAGMCHSGDVVWLKGSAGDAEIRLGGVEDNDNCRTGQHISTRAGHIQHLACEVLLVTQQTKTCLPSDQQRPQEPDAGCSLWTSGPMPQLSTACYLVTSLLVANLVT